MRDERTRRETGHGICFWIVFSGICHNKKVESEEGDLRILLEEALCLGVFHRMFTAYREAQYIMEDSLEEHRSPEPGKRCTPQRGDFRSLQIIPRDGRWQAA